MIDHSKLSLLQVTKFFSLLYKMNNYEEESGYNRHYNTWLQTRFN